MTFRFGDYGKLFKELLADPGEEWHVYYPVDDNLPTDEELQGFKVSRYAA